MPSSTKPRCSPHLTGSSVTSLWYAAIVTAFTSYIIYRSISRFLAAAALSWPADEAPYVSLNAYVGLVGSAVVVTPFFLLTALHKVGNLANDGVKLGSTQSACSNDPAVLPLPTPGLIRMLWTHGPSASASLHLLSAMFLLLPHTLLDAELTRAGLLPNSEIWSSDLDFLVPHTDRIRVLSTLDSNSLMSDVKPKPPPIHTQVTSHKTESGATFGASSRYLPSTAMLKERKRYHSNDIATGGKVSSIGKLPVGTTISIDKLVEDFKATEEGRSKASEQMKADIKNNGAPLVRGMKWKPLSPEVINFIIALFVNAIKYPSVFWSTNKCFSLLFSVMMMCNSCQILLLTTAFSIFYKLQVMGGVVNIHGTDQLFLNIPFTVTLYILSIIVLSLSCCAIYIYGYHKFVLFINKGQEKYHINYESETRQVGSYVGHILALVILVLLCCTSGPLIWDFSRVYKGSLDRVMFIAIISTIAHIFSWIILWLIFTVKNEWGFKLRITVARAYVSSARSIKLVNDVELAECEGKSSTPMLIVNEGKAFTVAKSHQKKAIINAIQQHPSKSKESLYWNQTTPSTMSPKSDRRNVDSPNDKNDECDYLLNEGSGPSTENLKSEKRKIKRSVSDARYVDSRQIQSFRRQLMMKTSSNVDDFPPLPPPPDLTEEQSVMSPDSVNEAGTPNSHSSASSTNHHASTSTTLQSEHSERRDSDENLSQLPEDPSNFPSYPKSLRASGHSPTDSTLIIRRQRDLSENVHHLDPIYGARAMTSFKEETIGKILEEDENKANSQVNTVAMPSPGLATPPPPMAPLRHSGHNIYGQTGMRLGSLYEPAYNYNLNYSSVNPKVPQAPNIPLPPIPQGEVAPPTTTTMDNDLPPPPPLSTSNSFNLPLSSLHSSRKMFSGPPSSRMMLVGRSNSLRFAHGPPPTNLYTNSLPHVLPRTSKYNTDV